MKVNKLILGMLTITLLGLAGNTKANADAYYTTKRNVDGYSQPSLTNWVGGSLQGDNLLVTKLGWYGRNLVGYDDAMSGWVNMRDLTLNDTLSTSEGIAKLNMNVEQYMPNEKVKRNYYYRMGKSHHPLNEITVRRTTYVYDNVDFKGKPVKVVRKNTKLRVMDLVKYGRIYRFELADGNYITANKKYVRFVVKEGHFSTKAGLN